MKRKRMTLWELLDNAYLFERQRQGAMKAVAKRLRPLWKENAK